MYKITCAYDGNAPHWEQTYESEFGAWENFFLFIDWGFADEYATVNLSVPSGKMYTRIFYREGRRVVTK